MSTLVAQTISNGTVSTSSANVIQGSAKAWVNFNGSGGAIRGSYNVSSITVFGTGSYRVNFTTAMSDANFCAVGLAGYNGGTILKENALTRVATSLELYAMVSTGPTADNQPFINVAIFR